MKLGKVIEDLYAAEETIRKLSACIDKYKELTYSEAEAVDLAERTIARIQTCRASVRAQLEQQEKRSCKPSNSSQL